ncbi:MAG TPA: hypothetical protein VNZ26_07185, partial [Vicinamibacterales bacterium]|nr:hypothetical protein [Vicinamibacterales bacterium]
MKGATFLLFVLSAYGCTSGNSMLSSGTTSPTPTPGSSSMSGQIGSVAWTASSVVVTYTNGILTVTG